MRNRQKFILSLQEDDLVPKYLTLSIKKELEKITINTSGAISEIFVGENWQSSFNMIPVPGTVIITDMNVKEIYGEKFPEIPVLTLDPGEGSKRLEIIERLAEDLLKTGIDRTGFILGIGGGVICDIAGFLASIYMRGIRCGYVSTTLLSQVDASTGGKNGVNLAGKKNMLGTIRQPEFVICDPSMLQSLTDQEYLSGLAELIKTAVIGDKDLFELIEKNQTAVLNRDFKLLSVMVSLSVKFKAAVVTEDEKENGLRRILNFGHTYGHAIEMYNSVKHGFAVASGMEMATLFSYEKGLIGETAKARIINLLRLFGLLKDHHIPDEEIEELILHDKKKTGTDINFVFTKGIGETVFERTDAGVVIDFYKRFREKK